MIRVPIEPNRVGFAATTDARFQAADYSGTGLQALGHGLEQLGEAGERFAQVQQQVQDRFNDAGAKAIDGNTTVERLTLLSDYQSKKGYEAEQAFPLVQQALAEISKRSEARATTKTMRSMLTQVNVERDRQAHADILKHYQDQSRVAAVTSAGARRDVSVEAAVQAVDPVDRDNNVATGEGEVRTLGQLRGDPPEVVESDVRKYHSNVLLAIGRKLALAGDLDAAAAHLEQHAPGLLDTDELKLREMLAEPLRQRDVEAHVDRRMGTATRTGDAPFSYSNPLHGAGRAPVVDASRQGIALPAPAGTPVFASRPGIARISQDETGGNILTIDHGNGRVTRYLALGQLAVSDGDTVTPDKAIGRVGDGGSGTAHLRYEIHDNGTPVAPEAVLAEVRQSPRRVDLDAVLADIDRDPSLDDGMLEDAKDAARRRAKLGNTLADRDEEAARTRVYDVIDTLPDQRLTATSQIPPDLWADLTEADRARLKSDICANNLGSEVPENGAAAADLNQLLWRDPTAFAKQDLRLVRSLMTPREYGALATLQSQLRADPADPRVIAHRRIFNRIVRAGQVAGLNFENSAARMWGQALLARTRRELETGTRGTQIPTNEEIEASFNRSIIDDEFVAIHAHAHPMGRGAEHERQAPGDYADQQSDGSAGGSRTADRSFDDARAYYPSPNPRDLPLNAEQSARFPSSAENTRITSAVYMKQSVPNDTVSRSDAPPNATVYRPENGSPLLQVGSGLIAPRQVKRPPAARAIKRDNDLSPLKNKDDRWYGSPFRSKTGRTFLFGGAGNDPLLEYLPRWKSAFEKAGISGVEIVRDSRDHTFVAQIRTITDAIDVPSLNHPFSVKKYKEFGYSKYDQAHDKQIDLVGYSHGAIVAAHKSLFLAHSGIKVDNVVLIAPPVSHGLVAALRKNKNIGRVSIINLSEFGDPIYAGMSDKLIAKSVPKLIAQMSDDSGHFVYGGSSVSADKRRIRLGEILYKHGVR